ncbi:MAG: DNA repair protein RadA [Tistlia sp.]|uniref:DNA repair protein RadA n=1 Tax=Tistlia sp. TaxID=3057121 RepID=UPI0034A35003
MAKPRSEYVCQSCGSVFPKWAGRCEACGAWNTLVEELSGGTGTPGGLGARPKARGKGRRVSFVGLKGEGATVARWVSGIAEFDRVTGGGLVPGSAVLVGGDPGIGKSTLLLQAAAALASNSGRPCAYVSGEEAIDQVRLRAERLGVTDAPVELASATSVRDLLDALDRPDGEGPGVVVIDSIQTMFVDTLESAPGTVAQVRASAQELIRLAKARGFVLLLVGHVTKEGMIAGPKVLEHMVDAVLTFEGERGHQFRILRTTKNRFGPTDEIGVFEMTERGLLEVANPSALFLAERRGEVSGASVFAGLEGTRPVLVEIQALVAPSSLGTPRRAVVGWDSGRLAMVLAVLEARCGLTFAGQDVYLNVAGGLRISEPAADLAVAAALVSALVDRPVPAEAVVFGEIGLAGEVRAVSQADQRLKEAAKLGFERAFMPPRRGKAGKAAPAEGALEILEIGHLQDLVETLSTVSPDAPMRRQA